MPDFHIPYFRPSIQEEEIAEVADSLRSGWITTGPKTHRFENDFAQAVKGKYAVATHSCTGAMHLSLEAIGVKRGDMVIVPTMTFAATAAVVKYLDAVPVLADCDDTLCIDTERLENTIKSILESKPVAGLTPPFGKLKAMMPMHYGGYCCDMKEIKELADKYKVDIVEDAAHCFPAYYRPDETSEWAHPGLFGKVGCFSFYANKCITTGEGGMAVTDDEEIADRIRIMSLHGMNKQAWKRYTAAGSWYYEVVAPGFKYNMTDISASLGIHQLKRAEEYRITREKISLRYNDSFRKLSTVQIPTVDLKTRISSWHLYPIRLNLDELSIDRAQFIDKLKEKGVGTSVHFIPLHRHPYYKETYNLSDGLFPNADREFERMISLPIFPSMADEEIDYVIESVRKISEDYQK